MDLTDEQRRRIEENRARARDRLRQRRLGHSQADSGTSGGLVDAAGGANGVANGSPDTSDSAPRDGGEGGGGANGVANGSPDTSDSAPRDGGEGGGAAGRRLGRGSGAGEGGRSGAEEGGGSGVGEGAGSGGKGPRGTRAGGGGRGDGSGRRGGGLSGSGESPAVAAASCEGCGGAEGDVRVDQELLEGFGVSVCRTCKLSREEFQCVPKKEAKETYLLPEGTIAVLKFIERDNPHHASWTKMKLFLRRDVASYSYKRWGGEDGLAAEKNRRDELKYDRSLARTKDVFKRGRSTTAGNGTCGGFLGDYDENR